jgi:type IV secretion system protein VirB5
MKTMKKVFFLMICLFLGGIHRGEAMAVFDSQSLAQQIKSFEQVKEQIDKATEQIKKLDFQIKQMKKHYKAVTGNKGFGEKHHDVALQQSLPQEWQGLYQATQRSMSALQSLKDTVASEEKFTGSVDDMQTHIEARMEQVAVTDKAVGMQAYQGVQERMKQVDRLMGEIKKTSDPKSIAELQARISIEQAYIQNEMTKLQLVGQLKRAEQRLIDQQKYQMSRRILNPKNTGMPQIR